MFTEPTPHAIQECSFSAEWVMRWDAAKNATCPSRAWSTDEQPMLMLLNSNPTQLETDRLLHCVRLLKRTNLAKHPCRQRPTPCIRRDHFQNHVVVDSLTCSTLRLCNWECIRQSGHSGSRFLTLLIEQWPQLIPLRFDTDHSARREAFILDDCVGDT